MFYKKMISMAAALAVFGMIATTSTAQAQTTESRGTVTTVYNDPGNEFLFALSVNGRCGSAIFHISRTATNYKEMVAMVLTALATNKTLGAWVTSCRGDRNIISHGYLLR